LLSLLSLLSLPCTRGRILQQPQDKEKKISMEVPDSQNRKITRNLKRKFDEMNHVQKVTHTSVPLLLLLLPDELNEADG